MKTIVLRRHPSYSHAGIEFDQGIPHTVDDGVADHLLGLGYFQLLPSNEPSSLEDLPEGIAVGSAADIQRQPKNYLTDEDLSGKTILFRRRGGIGDIVFVVTLADHIKKKFPTCQITIAVDKRFVPFARMFDCIFEAIPLEESTQTDFISTFDFVQHFNRVIEGSPDETCHIDDKDYFKAHWERVGLPESDIPSTFEPVSVAHKVGGDYALTQDVDSLLRELGVGTDPYLVMVLGSSNALKIIHSKRVAEIVENLNTARGGTRWRVICVGAGQDRVPIITQSGWASVATGQSLTVSAELIRRSCGVVGGDTGLVQFAAAIGVPTVSVWGPTDPANSITHYVGGSSAVIKSLAECAPCRRLRAAFCQYFSSGCPACMRQLEPSVIADTLRDVALVEHPASVVVNAMATSDGGQVAQVSEQKINIAILLDEAHRITGGGFYTWQIAKSLSDVPGNTVYVHAGMKGNVNQPFAYEDTIHGRTNLHVLKHERMDGWLPGDVAYDVVIGTPPSLGVQAVNAAKASGGRSVLLVYETPNYIKQYRGGLDAEEPYWEDYKEALGMCDAVWVISKEVKEALIEWIPQIREDKRKIGGVVRLVRPVIDTETANSILPENKCTAEVHCSNSVVLIARNVPYKQLEGTIQHIAEGVGYDRASEDEPFYIHVIGDGTVDLRSKVCPWQRWADRNVHLLAYENLAEDAKWNLLRQAKVLVHPSTFEGFGIPIAEGIYAGLPVVCRPLPVIKSNFGDAPFYFVSEEQLVKNVAALFDSWATKPKAMEKFGKAALLRTRNLKLPRMATLLYLQTPSQQHTAEISKRETAPEVEVATVDQIDGVKDLRVAMVTSWGNRCGIAETTRNWIEKAGFTYQILAPMDNVRDLIVEDGMQVNRCWGRQFTSRSDNLFNAAMDFGAHVVHFQHEVSFFCKNAEEEMHFFDVIRRFKESGVKVVVTLHTFIPSRFIDKLASAVDLVITTKEQEDFETFVPVHLPVDDVARFTKAESRKFLDFPDILQFVVGSFGMWNVHKGFREFLDTQDDVSMRCKEEVRYVLSGHRPPNNQYAMEVLRARADKINAGIIRTFTDYVDMPTIMRTLCVCDVLVFNYSVSGHSSASAAIRTGMKSGVPIVCTHSPMFSEFTDKRHVLKVPFGEPDALIEAILELKTNEMLRENLVRSCDQYLSKHTPDKTARRHEELYVGLVKGK